MKKIGIFLLIICLNSLADIYCPLIISCNNNKCSESVWFKMDKYTHKDGVYYYQYSDYEGDGGDPTWPNCSYLKSDGNDIIGLYINEMRNISFKIYPDFENGGWEKQQAGNYICNAMTPTNCPFITQSFSKNKN